MFIDFLYEYWLYWSLGGRILTGEADDQREGGDPLSFDSFPLINNIKQKHMNLYFHNFHKACLQYH